MIPKQTLYSTSNLTPPQLQSAVDHLNKDHVHNLTNIVQAHLGLKRPPRNVSVTALDYTGFEIKYTPTPSSFHERKTGSKGVRIPWKNGGKINDTRDARIQLVALSEESEKKVGKVPIVYSMPNEFPLSVLLWAALYFIEQNPQLKTTIKKTIPALVLNLAAKSPVQLTITELLKWIFVAHAAESIGMLAFIATRASSNRVTVSITTIVAWVVTTFSVGFPVWSKFSLINPAVASRK
ncbi:unnamed protein product [Sympodiomycopsis kandeliae]